MVPLLAVAACAPAAPPSSPGEPSRAESRPEERRERPSEATPAGPVGVLVMAHGGSPEWNAAVEDAVAPLAERIPTRIAFGMADPATLSRAAAELVELGVERAAVVRLFLSGSSFLHATRYLLGQRDDPPPHLHHMHGEDATPIDTPLRFAIDPAGLSDAALPGDILRARALSARGDGPAPAVLIVGHGVGDDRENDALLERMDGLADRVRETGRFGPVRVETLREDWPDARREAEARIRGWIEARRAAGDPVIVLPFRLFGFGPYASVLEGLEYEAEGVGLLPHPLVSEWLRQRTVATICGAGWTSPLEPCQERVADH